MMKKKLRLIIIIVFIFLSVSFLAFALPISPIQAQIVNCQGGSTYPSVRTGSTDLLTISGDNSSGIFQLSGQSICGNRVTISLHSTYASLKSLYFDQFKTR